MFPTFTGNSRKGRNVNLSGQRTNNPFTSTSWGASSTLGASKTVAQAQAERQQRQQERDRLKAAQRIQRTWRAHRVRRNLRNEWRQTIDHFYEAQSEDASQRSTEALRLVFATFQASNVQDRHRLALVTQDLLQTDFAAFNSELVDSHRIGKLRRMFLAALARCDLGNEQNQVALFLQGLGAILTKASDFKAFEQVLGEWYKVLGRLCQETGLPSSTQEMICSLVVAPLDVPHDLESIKHAAYQVLVFSFLTQPDLARCSGIIERLAASIDLDRLSNCIFDLSDRLPKHNSNAIVWLIAHYIAINWAKEQQSSRFLFIKALESLFPLCSAQIRAGFAVASKDSGDFDESKQNGPDVLPPFARQQLQRLVDKSAIQDLIDAFTATTGDTSSSAQENASDIAGLILTLINLFPACSEDIRMYLYVADFPTPQGHIPTAKYYWNATQKTSVFRNIESSQSAALDFLLRKPSTPAAEAVWRREWKTVLLFLESYIFVLRLMDDDDFFSALNPHSNFSGSSSRLRLASMSLDELERLTLFLKHLSFSMYYNAQELLTNSPWAETTNSTGRRGGGGQVSKADGLLPPVGVEFTTLRDSATTAMRMLYERDSRRPFLPKHHWLMTSKFDMESFYAAVILEEQRQHELANAGDGDDSSDDDQGWGSSRYADMEKQRQKSREAARARFLAMHSPKLEILRNMPFAIPFETRVQIFRYFIQLDKQRRRGGDGDADMWRARMMQTAVGRTNPLGKHMAKIRRGRVFADALKALWDLGAGLKEPIQVTFEDEFGMQEAGIDGGGVTKEFLDSVTTEAFTESELFVTNSKNAYYPNPTLIDRIKNMMIGPEETNLAVDRVLKEYEFLGRIIGKCMYEGILIDIVFAGFFLLKWAAANNNYRANINDLRELDEELYQGMLSLKNYTGDIQNDLALDFTITDPINIPGEPTRTIVRPLVPNGESIPVTNENRPLYISYVARHRLVRQPYAQTNAFLRGLGAIIDPSWLSMFNQLELQRLVGGDSSEINVDDLQRNTHYSGAYTPSPYQKEHPTIGMFWEAMHELHDDERREVLKYVTSTPRAPLLGFSQLSPRFTIRDAGQNQDRLPSASTCVNLLKLPQYRSKEVLKEKLLYAVKSGAGFDLS
ncbi:hypothetical protein B0T20DRAFT_403743 [Sordaria brevicollis]|uniref:HECT-type E3 ubiquitin transferase n=1 Tax=Sordaria brevicollis TaxID=83679 RepID=A0AAE0PM03_SORBR|nr:hypothetical protein B0T20DRAFT_403743 [Sordaria brevicollis]